MASRSICIVAVAISVLALQCVVAQLGKDAYRSGNLPRQPARPIMGILSQPQVHKWSKPCLAYIQQDYVDWMAQAGIRAMVVPYDLPFDEMKVLLDQLNGVLFTGGMQNTSVPSVYYSASKWIYDYTIEANARGDPFVLWGTCQGMQLIAMNAANDQTIMDCDYVGTMTSMLPLEMTPLAKGSRLMSMLDEAPSMLWDDMTTKNSTANGHDCGVLTSHFENNAILKEQFNVLSVNEDTAGKPFVSTFEHKTAEIYALQWHPEGAQLWYDMGFNKQPSTIRVAQYMANFLASRLPLNNRAFVKIEDAFTDLLREYEIMNNIPQQYTGFYCVDVPPSKTKRAKHLYVIDELRWEANQWKIVSAVLVAAIAACLVSSKRRNPAAVNANKAPPSPAKSK